MTSKYSHYASSVYHFAWGFQTLSLTLLRSQIKEGTKSNSIKATCHVSNIDKDSNRSLGVFIHTDHDWTSQNEKYQFESNHKWKDPLRIW